MSDTRKTSDDFQGVTGDYATYTNDVDKPYPLPKDRPAEAPETAKVVDPPRAEEFYDDEGKGEDSDPPQDGPESKATAKAAPKAPAKATADK